MTVCVFGGASPVAAQRHKDLAFSVGEGLARIGEAVVFGGGGQGIMGAAASGAVRAGGRVTGVLPRFLFDREPPHPEVDDMRVVADMHARKSMMYELSDAFLVLPGGFGTLEEAMEIMTWRQLALHSKPAVFLGDERFWAGVQATFDIMHADGFLSDADRALAHFSSSVEDALAAICSHTQPGQAPASRASVQIA